MHQPPRSNVRPGGAPSPVDLSRLLKGIRGDEELLARLIANFLSDCPGRMRDISEAVAAGDGRALERAAHALRGGLTVFGAEAATEQARRLELLGREGEMGKARALLPALEAEMAAVEEFLAARARGG